MGAARTRREVKVMGKFRSRDEQPSPWASALEPAAR